MPKPLASRQIASPPSPLALLTLVGATAEWRAGLAPSCVSSVRLLDAVDFTVHAGECVVVHHDDPAGVRVLLAALSGHARLLAGGVWRGARVASPGVRIRRASVRADLVAPLVEGWGSAAPTVTAPRSAGYAVHLLRASRLALAGSGGSVAHGDARRTAAPDDAWRSWARAQRQHGGAIVIVADTRGTAGAGAVVNGPYGNDPRRPPTGTPVSTRTGVHEASSAYVSSVMSVRECVLRNGRLLTPESQETYAGAQYCWPSDSPLVVDG